jgi:hypothetical protein
MGGAVALLVVLLAEVTYGGPVPTVASPTTGAFPHHLLGEALRDRVDASGLVDYAGLASDRAALDAYVAAIATVSPASDPDLFPTRQDQLAYYLNAHTALSLVSVLDHPRRRPVLGGRRVDLYRLERDVIAASFQDPRVHAVLHHPTKGAPPLRPEPLDPAHLDAELDDAAERLVHDVRFVLVEADAVSLSRIFRWSARDFRAAGGVRAWVGQMRGEPLPDDHPVVWLPYDRSLNAQSVGLVTAGRRPRRGPSRCPGSGARGGRPRRGSTTRRRG